MSNRWPESKAMAARLSGLGFVRVELAPEVASTNDQALQAARQGGPVPAAFLAQRQRAGRGSRGRRWQSPAGGLWMTLLLPAPALRLLPWLALGTGAAAAAAICERCGLAAGVKWPNDIMVVGAKLGGVLVETTAGRAAVGIGINANNDPPAGVPEAESLARLTGQPVALDLLAEAVAAGVLGCHQALLEGKWQAIRRKWSALDVLAGANALLETKTGVWQVKCLGVTERGTLVCEQEGRRREIRAASSVRLRALCPPA